MSSSNDPHAWLDPIIAEQKRIQGAAADLIEAACEAEELFTEDELEEEARRRRCEEAAQAERIAEARGETDPPWRMSEARYIARGLPPPGYRLVPQEDLAEDNDA